MYASYDYILFHNLFLLVKTNVNNDTLVSGKEFHGKIINKTIDGKFILESKDLLELLIGVNAIR